MEQQQGLHCDSSNRLLSPSCAGSDSCGAVGRSGKKTAVGMKGAAGAAAAVATAHGGAMHHNRSCWVMMPAAGGTGGATWVIERRYVKGAAVEVGHSRHSNSSLCQFLIEPL